MNMVRWKPAFDMLNVHSEIDRVFEELVGGSRFGSSGNGGSAGFLPVDIKRSDANLVVEASVPGFKPEEVSVTVDGGILTISAQREASEEKREGEYLRQERRFSSLYRQITLGEGVDGDKAAADFNNGVLTVTIPLVSKREPKRIPVRAEASK
jgi:HSP20 family protein